MKIVAVSAVVALTAVGTASAQAPVFNQYGPPTVEPTGEVAGTVQTVAVAGVAGAPAATVQVAGVALPFTGAEIGFLALGGLLLVASGGALRRVTAGRNG